MNPSIYSKTTSGSASNCGLEVFRPAETDRYPPTEVGAASRDASPSPEVFRIHAAFPTRTAVQAHGAGCAPDLTEKPVQTIEESESMTSHANPTMSDLAGRLNPESPEACATCKILEESELLRDVTWLKDESSLRPISTLLRTTRSGASSRSHRQPADPRETLETLETIALVDKKLAELNHNDAAWRAGEELPYLEAMSHDFERALFHGTMPRATERFHGFAERYARLDAKKAATAPNVIDAGGRGKNLTSIWLVGWSPSICYCFYPKNTAAGLRIEDIGEEAALDKEGGEFRALKTCYTWTFGLSVRDWRYVVRIANVPKSLVEHVAGECPTQGTESPSPSSSAQHPLCALLTQALNLIPSHEGVRLAFYGNRDVATALNLLRAEPRNTCLSGKKTESRPAVLFFNGIPFRRVDALTWGEKTVR